MKPSTQAVRAITGVYFQKLVTTSAAIGGALLVLFWVVILWLTVNIDPLWGMFTLLLAPLTIVGFMIYGLMLSLGNGLMPRPLTKGERKKLAALGSRIFCMGNKTAPWPCHLMLISKDVLRGRESDHIKEMLTNTSSLREDFVSARQLFSQ